MLSDAERRTIEALEADLLADREFRRAVDPIGRRLRAQVAPVVVGIGPGDVCTGPLEWAAAEAAAHGCPLRIVHALRPPLPLDPFGVVPAFEAAAAQRLTGRAALDEALAWVRAAVPAVEVTGSLVPGPVGRALLRESHEARLLVLGARAPEPRQPGLGGSFPWRVTAAARCPITVVHPRAAAGRAEETTGVVAGVDGTPTSEDALGFAFRCARQRGTCLTAVHAWSADRPADLEAVTAPLATSEAGAYRRTEAAVARWRAVYPDVPVVVEVVHRDPTSALIEGSAGATLVVVGTRGRGRARGAVFGSVSRGVVDGVPGPVAVVPPAAGSRRAHHGARW